MTQMKKQSLAIALFLFPAIFIGISSCRDDSPKFATPEIAVTGSDSIDLSPGETVKISLALKGDGGAKSVVVMKNGGFLREYPVHATATEFVYTTEAVPGGLSEGDEIRYGFILTNNDNVDSPEIPFVIKVALYGKVSVGDAELYNLNIGTDGIVSAGTEITLIKNRNYFVPGPLTFEPGSVLKIEEGVWLYMNAGAQFPAGIEIGGEAYIQGTAVDPVVMTSSRVLTPDNPAEPGDWSVFRLTGTGESSNNGKVSYLRIEYGGDRAFRLSDVGEATEIDHVQVYKSEGEGFMITDGNAGLKYIVATDCKGGSYRLGDKYAGKMQFVVSVNSEYFAENDDFAIREDAAPVISNVTLLGAGSGLGKNTHGMRMRANAAPKVYNAVIAEFPRRGLRAADNVEITDLDGRAVFAYSYIFNVPRDPFRDLAKAFAGTFNADGTIATNPFHNNVTNLTGGNYTLKSIPGIGIADFVPDAEQASEFNPTSLGSFFAAAPFVGAVKNSNEDWTKGWVKNPDGSIR
ncbi:hypothetical protein D7D25_15210 [Proteiniphilum sp. X52]|nr:hypothetical protein D7D25_15210 [Proteiniphilum sp. X52]